jgi:hypothetical protein
VIFVATTHSPVAYLNSAANWSCPFNLRVNLLLSLSRLNHWLPRAQAHPEVVQGTAEFHDQIADAFFPQADPIFDDGLSRCKREILYGGVTPGECSPLG